MIKKNSSRVALMQISGYIKQKNLAIHKIMEAMDATFATEKWDSVSNCTMRQKIMDGMQVW